VNKSTILIVDDDDSIRECLRLILDKYNIIEAGSGKDALKACRLEKPELIILDVVLPDMTGKDVLKEIRETDSYGDPMVVIITGMNNSLKNNTDDNAEQAARNLWKKAYHVTDFISKPFDLNNLQTIVNKALSEKKE